MGYLNQKVLPPEYLALTQISLGGQVEVDVATVEFGSPSRTGNGATALLETWAPPAPPLLLPAVFPDEFTVQIVKAKERKLVAAIELVSPGNKDRPQSRRAFAAKCAAYLQTGLGLIIVDLVTERRHNLHDELVNLLGWDSALRFFTPTGLYAVAYHPTRRDEDLIEAWPEVLTLGEELPTMPLALRGGPILPLDLEVSYMMAREMGRL